MPPYCCAHFRMTSFMQVVVWAVISTVAFSTSIDPSDFLVQFSGIGFGEDAIAEESVTGNLNTAQFVLVNDPGLALRPLGLEPRPQDTALSCARLCQSEPSCSCFTYSRVSDTCTLGGGVTTTDPPRSTDLLLYIGHEVCDVSSGFHLASNANTASCVCLKATRTNFTVARDFCRDVGGHLYTLKSLAKLSLLEGVLATVSKDVWVGLDDMAEEGVYRWDDDGSVADPDLFGQMVTTLTPVGHEEKDCLRYTKNTTLGPLNDRKCHTLCYFLCEKGF